MRTCTETAYGSNSTRIRTCKVLSVSEYEYYVGLRGIARTRTNRAVAVAAVMGGSGVYGAGCRACKGCGLVRKLAGGLGENGTGLISLGIRACGVN
eukprot:scaffold669419_cov65-Prasinocladus_malaysianus.AAC.2